MIFRFGGFGLCGLHLNEFIIFEWSHIDSCAKNGMQIAHEAHVCGSLKRIDVQIDRETIMRNEFLDK